MGQKMRTNTGKSRKYTRERMKRKDEEKQNEQEE